MYSLNALQTDWSETAERKAVSPELRQRLENDLGRVLRGALPQFSSEDQSSYLLRRVMDTIDNCIEQESSLEQWIYLRIAHADPNAYRHTIQRDIAPAISELQKAVPVNAWWWLSKADSLGPAIRLRVATFPHFSSRVERELTKKLAEKGYEVGALRYEPEMRLFGGVNGLKIAHELFFRDSDFLARWAQCENTERYPFIPVGLSLALMVYLTGAVGLDTFERWDVFAQLSHKRPINNHDDDGKLREYEELAMKVIMGGPQAIFELVKGRQSEILAEYVARLNDSAKLLSQTYFSGGLECGLREFLVPVMIFHLNRVGLPWGAQTRLAYMAAKTFQRIIRKDVAAPEGS